MGRVKGRRTSPTMARFIALNNALAGSILLMPFCSLRGKISSFPSGLTITLLMAQVNTGFPS